MATAPAVLTWYCTASRPLMNTALPLAFTQVKVVRPLLDRNKSPMRPPQPEVAPSGFELCQTDCWSLCENSLGGSGTLAAVYCALVVGWTRVPMLKITPNSPLLKMGIKPLSSGANATWRPGAMPLTVEANPSPVPMGKAFAVRAERCRVMPDRTR